MSFGLDTLYLYHDISHKQRSISTATKQIYNNFEGNAVTSVSSGSVGIPSTSNIRSCILRGEDRVTIMTTHVSDTLLPWKMSEARRIPSKESSSSS